MPAYLHHLAIDWGWPRLTAAERAVARLHEARAQADPGTHTRETLMEALSDASRELAGRELRAQAEDEHGDYVLVAKDGRCWEAEDPEFDEDGRFPETLTVDDYRAAGVEKLWVGLYWPDAMLAAIKDEAARLDRSLSWIVQKAFVVAANAPAAADDDDSALRAGSKRKQSVYLTLEIYGALKEAAAREDCSMSACAQRAIIAAWPTITALPPA